MKGRTKNKDTFPEHAALIVDLMEDLRVEEKREAASLLRRVERCADEHDASSSTD